MRILFVFFFACLCKVSILTAQVKLEGKITDEKEQSVTAYNITVLNRIDSSFLTTKQFTTDTFSIEIPSLQCLIKISSFGFKEIFVSLPENQDSDRINLGTILLPQISHNLDEVVITGKKPFMTMQGDKVIYNIENSTVSNAGTAIDLLKQTPYIIADQDDNITVAGKDKTMILINGKRLRNNEELQVINSAQIKQVEIIENPSAKYEAEGHAVINVILRKIMNQGLTSSVYTGHRQGKEGTQFLNPEISYQVNKLRFWGNFGVELYRSGGKGEDWIKYEKEDYLFKSYSYDLHLKREATDFTYNTGIDYNFNASNTLGIYLDGYAGNSKRKRITNLEREKNDLKYPTLQNETYEKYKPQLNSTGINYSYNGKSGSKVTFMGDVTNYISKTDNDISETNLTSLYVNEMKNFSDAKYNLYSAQIDVEIPVSDKKNKLEFGGKFASINNDNNFLFERLTAPNQWLVDSTFTSITSYSEQILGAYALWLGNIKKWQYSMGFRVENIWIENMSDNEIIYKNSDFQFFPNISVTRPTENMTYRLSYTRRISRPSYSAMNNNFIYIDTLSVRKGNPFLLPTIYNTTAFNLLYRKKINISISYSYIEAPRDLLYINDKENIEHHTILHTNVENTWSASMNMSGSFRFGKWSTQPFASFSYGPVRIIDDEIVYTFRNPGYTIRSINQIELSENYTINAGIAYIQPAMSFKKFGEQLDFDLGCTKKLLQNRLILQGSAKYVSKIWSQEHKYSYKYTFLTWEGNTYGLSFVISARFYLNNNSKSVKKNKTSSEDEKNRF
ncbi:MAG: outer membrane beta-barrel family protein [Bacteroidales bacterium]|jgi:hypothetical protein|nr:outer membrane beta-barrel family protein [Bacteroidales bacterium]